MNDMKTKVARGIARSIRDMVEASASIINIDASEDRYLNPVMEARCRHVETLDRTEQAIVNLLVCQRQTERADDLEELCGEYLTMADAIGEAIGDAIGDYKIALPSSGPSDQESEDRYLNHVMEARCRHVEMEFPDYDDILPELEGFVDSSWNRDACPSLSKVVGKGGRRLTVFVDYKDLSFRENDAVALEFRYTVVLISFWQGEEDAATLLRTNDWSEVVKLTGEIK